MAWVAVGSAAVSVVGGLASANQAKGAADRAALAASPYGVSGPFGSVTYNPNHTASYDLGATGNQFSQLAQQLGLGTLGNYNSNPIAGLTPDILGAYGDAQSNLRRTGGQQDTNANNLFASMQALGNDPTAIGNNYYQLLSQQAAPGQSQMFNTLQNKLFAQGRLGTTGGGNDFKGFYDSANQADLGRQIAGQQFGQQWQQQLQQEFGNATSASQQTAANRFGLATNLLQTGQNNNQATTANAGGLQNLFSSMFQPLFQSQGLGAGGNPNGAKYGLDASNSANNGMFGALSGAINGVDWGSLRGGGVDKGAIDKGAMWGAGNVGTMIGPVTPIGG